MHCETSAPENQFAIMNKTKHTASFEIAQPVNDLFPLFSPEGEKLWVPGWDYENIMGSTDIHENYVFLTRNHDHESNDAVWLVKKYDPKEYCIQLYKIEPEYKVGIIEVTCIQLSKTHTKVQVTYEYMDYLTRETSLLRVLLLQSTRALLKIGKEIFLLHISEQSLSY